MCQKYHSSKLKARWSRDRKVNIIVGQRQLDRTPDLDTEAEVEDGGGIN